MRTDDATRAGTRVRDLIAAYLGGQPVPPDIRAEPAAVRCGTAVVYLRQVDGDPAVLRVFSPLVRGIARTPELLAELNDINARLNFLRVFWRAGTASARSELASPAARAPAGTVYAAAELLAATLSADELAYACDAVADAADYYDVRLWRRFGGAIAYAE